MKKLAFTLLYLLTGVSVFADEFAVTKVLAEKGVVFAQIDVNG